MSALFPTFTSCARASNFYQRYTHIWQALEASEQEIQATTSSP
jgi:hypothetical protein